MVVVRSLEIGYTHKFLTDHAPLTKESGSKDPKDPQLFLKIYLKSSDDAFK